VLKDNCWLLNNKNKILHYFRTWCLKFLSTEFYIVPCARNLVQLRPIMGSESQSAGLSVLDLQFARHFYKLKYLTHKLKLVRSLDKSGRIYSTAQGNILEDLRFNLVFPRTDLINNTQKHYISGSSDWLRAGRSGDQIPVWAKFFTPVQTGPGAHPALCRMGTESFQGVKSGRDVTLTPHPLLVPWSWKSRAIPLLPLWAIQPQCLYMSALYFTYLKDMTLAWHFRHYTRYP
jgi:hypothetical protein